MISGTHGSAGKFGYQGATFKTSQWSTCHRHPDNKHKYDDFQKTKEWIEAFYLQHNALPCYMLEHVQTDHALVELCKRLGANCCYEPRSDLFRVLLGIPTTKTLSDAQMISNALDRAIYLGDVTKVRQLIAQDHVVQSIRRYDDELIVRNFLQFEFLSHHILKNSCILPCLMNTIVSYIS